MFDRAAPTYEQTGVSFFGPLGAALAAHARLRPGERVLDIGCGRGVSLLPAAEAVGTSGTAIGIDIATGMVKAATAEAQRRGLTHVRVEVGDAEAPEFADASFDVVLGGLVLFFLPDAPKAIQSCARLLRSGGRLVLSTFTEPTETDRQWQHRLGIALGPYLPPPQTPQPASPPPPPPKARLRTEHSLRRLLADGGFGNMSFTQTTHRSVFARPEQLWDWLWSAGMRATMESIAPQAHAHARAALAALAAEHLQAGDGNLGWTTGIRLTTAERP